MGVKGNGMGVRGERNGGELKWDGMGGEQVVECSGLLLSKEKGEGDIEGGGKYVVM